MFMLMSVEFILGYVLLFGQMSFWGLTVILSVVDSMVSLLTTGVTFKYFILTVYSNGINFCRLFIFHELVSVLLLIVMCTHVWLVWLLFGHWNKDLMLVIVVHVTT